MRSRVTVAAGPAANLAHENGELIGRSKKSKSIPSEFTVMMWVVVMVEARCQIRSAMVQTAWYSCYFRKWKSGSPREPGRVFRLAKRSFCFSSCWGFFDAGNETDLELAALGPHCRHGEAERLTRRSR